MPLEPTQEIERLIDLVAAELNVDRHLIKAHMKRESDFRPGVYRDEPHIKDRSIGLMQVLVKTAQWIMNDKNITEQQLYDPYFNIKVGATYIKKNLDRYGGDLDKAIAAYNAGSARLSKINKDKFINQDYVDFVKKWHTTYKQRPLGKIGIISIIALSTILALFYRELL